MITFTFDVESIGLHGEGFAVGVCIHEDGLLKEDHTFACLPAAARGTGADREWIHANVPFLEPTNKTPRDVRYAFWALWKFWKERGAIMLADCAWPVEARFLNACVEDDPDKRNWEGPYPLHDLASVLLSEGHDPKGTYERRADEQPAHHPLSDAKQTARIFWDLQCGIDPRLAGD